MLLERIYRFRLALTLVGVGVLAGILRFVALSHPSSLVFDESHYVKDAYSLMELGYEGNWDKGSNSGFAEGNITGLNSRASFVVHPPLGKWLIVIGMKLFGANPFGWRFSAAFLGTLTVVLVAWIAHHLFRSVVWGGVTGVFLAIDGQHIVLSRTALLDIFLTFFVVVAFGLLLIDRYRNRQRLRERAARERERLDLKESDPLPGLGPSTGVRWYRLAAIVALGLATGVKWSGVYFAVAFLFLSLLWELADRRKVVVSHGPFVSFVRLASPLVVITAVLLPATYVASYASWFASDDSYMRHWAEEHEGEGITWLPDDLRSFVEYHDKMYGFHINLTYTRYAERGEEPHRYAAKPWWFLLQAKPTAFFWETYETGEGWMWQRHASSVAPYWETVGMGDRDLPAQEKWVAETIALGNPLLWWAGTVAFFYAVWGFVRRFDLLATLSIVGTIGGILLGIPLLWLPSTVVFLYALIRLADRLDLLSASVMIGVIGGWVPWLFYSDRLIFTFYSVAFAPWVMLGLVWALRRIAQPPQLEGGVSRPGALTVGGFVALAFAVSGFFMPLWNGQWIPNSYWDVHMPDFPSEWENWNWV